MIQVLRRNRRSSFALIAKLRKGGLHDIPDLDSRLRSSQEEGLLVSILESLQDAIQGKGWEWHGSKCCQRGQPCKSNSPRSRGSSLLSPSQFINGYIREKHDLDLSRREKPVLHVNDLLLVLHHLWALDEEAFPDERQRAQLSALLLTAAYTACRPSSLVYTMKAKQKGGISNMDDDGRSVSKTLCYKHVKVLLLRNENPQERDVMVMEVDLTHVKGDLTNPKP